MLEALTTYTDLDAANAADDHYGQRRNATKSIALRSAEYALEVAADNRKLMTKFYDRGLATWDDLAIAVDAELLVKHLVGLLNDFWFIERQAKAAELEAFKDGKIGYSASLQEPGWVAHPVEASQ